MTVPDEDRKELFDRMYRGVAPWETGRPQSAIVRLAEAGDIGHCVLDMGCGMGETAIYLAGRTAGKSRDKAHEVWGIDLSGVAVAAAIDKAKRSGVKAHFLQGSALDPMGRTFDTVIDIGLLHTLPGAKAIEYAAALKAVVAPGGTLHVMCFSDRDSVAHAHKYSAAGLETLFSPWWKVRSLIETRFDPPAITSAPGPLAWLLSAQPRP